MLIDFTEIIQLHITKTCICYSTVTQNGFEIMKNSGYCIEKGKTAELFPMSVLFLVSSHLE